ncbi:hypothetical protein LAZ67_5003066 [Cordylochernes scorpioides]|uniref:Mos1 transposase HTH domain-containing protein n=1 Tax=Cordylochernes scorpioides TaxID=51811 RepID=A0ABY6KJX7_9ARAC|nr:hypothetical protein LAZ67_5003066 [Cordylochernes scorpioides]
MTGVNHEVRSPCYSEILREWELHAPGQTPSSRDESLSAYGEAVMSQIRVFDWYKRFKEGREETVDNERSGRPSTLTTPEKVDKVLELVREDRRITVREVAEEAGISFGSTQSIMKDILGVGRLNAVLVPKVPPPR